MTDYISIKGLEVFAYHGVFESEKHLGQRYKIDLKIGTRTQRAGLNDDLEKTIDYGALAKEVSENFSRKSFDLIEAAAEDTSIFILDNYKDIEEIYVRVIKPYTPVKESIDEVAVEIFRKKSKAYIGLGANIGNREENLDKALKLIGESKYMKILKKSSLYETPAWGVTDQPDFLNMAIKIETSLTPHELLHQLNNIEEKLGRTRLRHWGERNIDLDILFFDDLVIFEDDLIIPHPYIKERGFVLDPLNEIDPYFNHPVYNSQIRDLKANLDSKNKN